MKPIAVCVGDNCIDLYLSPVNRRFIGGNALNVAVHMQSCGMATSYIGVVGNDSDGQSIIDVLNSKGLDTSHLRVVPGQTAQTHIRLTDQGDREFVYEYLGPQETLVLDDDTIQFIASHELIHTTQNGAIHQYLPLFRKFPALLVSFDYGERSSPEFIDNTLGNVDVAFFSLPEHMAEQGADLARRMYACGPRLVVVTLGARGSLAYNGELYSQPAQSVKIVDTLGAGDSYIGVFLAKWLEKRPIPECMQEASNAATRTCTIFGAWVQDEVILKPSISN